MLQWTLRVVLLPWKDIGLHHIGRLRTPLGSLFRQGIEPGTGRRSKEGANVPPWAWVGAIFLLFIAIHRWDVVDSPPYTEQAAGHWGEADWLIEHHFNYHDLRVRSLQFEEGGPRAYWCSILPTVMALGMEMGASPRTFIAVYRILLVWLPAAIILVFAFEIVRERAGAWIGVGVAACLYVNTIFSVQVEMVGMDMVMTATAMFWWFAMHRKRFWLAALLGVVPFFLKPSAFVVPLGGAAYHGISAALSLYPRRNPRALPDAVLSLVNLGVFALQIYLLVLGGNLHGRVMLFSGFDLWMRSSPDLLVITAVTLLATIVWLATLLRPAMAKRPVLSNFVATADDVMHNHPLIFSGWFVVLLNLAAATTTYYESRHILLVVPFVFALFGRMAGELEWSRPPVVACLLGYFAFSCANAYGEYYPRLEPPATRGWGVLERSLEYRADHLSNIAASRFLDQNVRGEPMLVADQFLYFLKFPRFGYVRHPFGDGVHFYIARDENVLRIVDDQPETLVVTHVTCQVGTWPFPAYVVAEPDSSRDEILYNDGLEPPVIIYRRRFSNSGSEAQRMRQYVDLLFSDAVDVDPAVRLAIVGEERQALRYVAAETNYDPNAPAARSELIRRVREYLSRIETKVVKSGDEFLVARLRRTTRTRLDDLEAGKPLGPLPWSQRTYLETWPQRLQYFPSDQTIVRQSPSRATMRGGADQTSSQP